MLNVTDVLLRLGFMVIDFLQSIGFVVIELCICMFRVFVAIVCMIIGLLYVWVS
jgi:hypothetical protein